MNTVRLSEKATQFIDSVQKETNKPINIIISTDIGANMMASTTPNPDAITINVSDRLLGNQQEAIDQSVCHEAVHGLLIHRHNYYYPILVYEPTQEERMSVNLCMTMIEDIVVNKILADNGIQPFAPQYIPMVRREIDAMNNNQDIYKDHLAIGQYFYQRFKVFRYVMACGFLKYFQLVPEQRKLISRFVKHFERSFRELMPEASQIVEWIETNDIFTPEGHRIVVEKCLNMWGLNGKVQFTKLNCYNQA